MLLDHGADPNLRVFNDIDDPGSQLRPVLAEYLASNTEPDAEVVNLLLRHGAKVITYPTYNVVKPFILKLFKHIIDFRS